MTRLADLAAGLLGEAVTGVEPVHGGDLSQVLRLHLGTGRRVIVKGGPDPEAEAAMLAALAGAGAAAPAVVAASPQLLILEELPDRGSLAGASWAHLGQMLRALHGVTGDAYGWDADYAFGPVPIRNARLDDWPAFWAERRLLPEAERLPAQMARRLRALADRLPDLLPRRPPASLLHGDLWGGNVLTDGARISGLIDPACYHGHGEVDLAMLSLFGSPSGDFWAAYGGPETGWERRCAIYQLWPAIVHYRLFGAGYGGMVEGLLARAGV
jgi:fructosamine-3-kinase